MKIEVKNTHTKVFENNTYLDFKVFMYKWNEMKNGPVKQTPAKFVHIQNCGASTIRKFSSENLRRKKDKLRENPPNKAKGFSPNLKIQRMTEKKPIKNKIMAKVN